MQVLTKWHESIDAALDKGMAAKEVVCSITTVFASRRGMRRG